MIEEAEQKGLLKRGGTIVEASSGNQGIAIAMIGAVKGYKVIITVTEKISEEKLKTIKAYGAEVVVCPATNFIEDPKSYHSKAAEIQRGIASSFMPNQYFNLSNPQSHFTWLAPELWNQTKGKITHFFAAAGTGGTISGVGKFLKEKNPNIKIIAVDAASSFHATNGHPKPYKLEGIGIDFKTPCLDTSVIDEFVAVTDDDAIGMLRTMAAKFGFLIGTSSGAVAFAAHQYASTLQKGDLAIMIFGDSGRAYLTKNFYS